MTALVLTVAFFAVFYSVAVLLAIKVKRDAERHGANGWLWLFLIVLNPVLFGLGYLLLGRRNEVAQLSSPVVTEFKARSSSASHVVDEALTVAAAIAGGVAAALVIVVGITGRPVAGVGLLLGLGVPLLFGGQAWWLLRLTRRRASGSMRRLLPEITGGLSSRVTGCVAFMFFLGWLAAMTAFSAFSDGSPTQPTPGCKWPLENHGSVTCVSEATYLHAEAGLQRFVAGIMMGFFVFHFGVGLSELYLRQSGSGGPVADNRTSDYRRRPLSGPKSPGRRLRRPPCCIGLGRPW